VFIKVSGSIPSNWMVLFLLVSPLTMETREGLIPNAFARNLMQAWLAAPSTGGEVSLIFKMVVDSENLVARRPRLNSRRKLNARLVGFEFKGHESDRIGLYLFRESVKDLVAALRLLIKYVLSVFRRRISPWRWLTSASTFRLCRSASSRAWFTNFRAFS